MLLCFDLSEEAEEYRATERKPLHYRRAEASVVTCGLSSALAEAWREHNLSSSTGIYDV